MYALANTTHYLLLLTKSFWRSNRLFWILRAWMRRWIECMGTPASNSICSRCLADKVGSQGQLLLRLSRSCSSSSTENCSEPSQVPNVTGTPLDTSGWFPKSNRWYCTVTAPKTTLRDDDSSDTSLCVWWFANECLRESSWELYCRAFFFCRAVEEIEDESELKLRTEDSAKLSSAR